MFADYMLHQSQAEYFLIHLFYLQSDKRNKTLILKSEKCWISDVIIGQADITSADNATATVTVTYWIILAVF